MIFTESPPDCGTIGQMRQTRPVAVLLLVTAVLVASVMQAGEVGPAPIVLMLLLSAAPLVVILASARTQARIQARPKETAPNTWPPARPVADPLPAGTVRTGVGALLVFDAGFALTQLVAAVGDLGSGGGRLHPEPLAAAAIVLLSGLFVVLLTADRVLPASTASLTWAAAGRWARANGRPIALTAVGVVVVVGLGWALVASSGQRSTVASASGQVYVPEPEPPRGVDPGLVQAVIADTIPDPALRACVSAAAQRAPSPGQGLPDLVDLSCSGSTSTVKIVSLEGLQQLTNLQTLDLSGNALQELSPLIGMTSLRKMDLSDNQITGVQALGRVPGLVRLTLTGNRITDPSPLQDLPALTMLNIANNRVADAGDLVKCPKVDELWIGGNPITDVTVLRSMPSLLGVDLTGIDSTRLTGVDILRAKRVYVGGLA
jgi:hypothetical protein